MTRDALADALGVHHPPAEDDARIVSLGEATHGTREIFQLKHRMLEYLVERMDFTVFGIEASYPDCVAIDEYVRTGKGDAEAALAVRRAFLDHYPFARFMAIGGEDLYGKTWNVVAFGYARRFFDISPNRLA